MPSPTVYIDLDTDTGILTVSCSSEWEGITYLYDSSNNLVDYETSVNVTFDVSSLSPGTYNIMVSTDWWEATGSITL
ncbi:MAG: hypothetical protein LIP02_13525 [Bacteroidales bacterium]|nr:hypothetical protein [Bacteroidales bacterium]